jgi:catechol 2,3-dioxygenase-like lactoylglutathione lyase family enzyme
MPGMHHIGLSTLDFEGTIEFYTKKLGWQIAFQDILEPKQGGRIKHVFLDSGGGCYFAFMCPERLPGVPEEYATDINSAQNLPGAFYHFAMAMDSLEALKKRREELIAKGIEVTPVIDHNWARSIYFRDPNGLLLEYCATVRELTAEDRELKHQNQDSFGALKPEEMAFVRKIMDGPRRAAAPHQA